MPKGFVLPTRLAVLFTSVLGLSLAAGCDVAGPDEGLQEAREALTSLTYTLADFGDGAEDVSNSPRDLYGAVNSCDGARFWVVGEADNLASYEVEVDSLEGSIAHGPYPFPVSQVVGFRATINNGSSFFSQFNLDVPFRVRNLLANGYAVEHVGLSITGYSAYGHDELLPGGHEQIYKARITARFRKGTAVTYTGIDWHEANLRLEMYGCDLQDTIGVGIGYGDIGPLPG